MAGTGSPGRRWPIQAMLGLALLLTSFSPDQLAWAGWSPARGSLRHPLAAVLRSASLPPAERWKLIRSLGGDLTPSSSILRDVNRRRLSGPDMAGRSAGNGLSTQPAVSACAEHDLPYQQAAPDPLTRTAGPACVDSGIAGGGSGSRALGWWVDLQLQVLRQHRWQTLPAAATDRTVRIGWRESALRVVFQPRLDAPAEPMPCRMRLQGLDRGWVDIGQRGRRIYTHLRPGLHRLQIQAQPGVAGRLCAGANWELNIVRPPWLRWWAWLMYLGIGLGGWLGWRCSRHAAGAAAEGDRRWHQLVAELGHELRTPLSGLLGMLDLLALTTMDRRQQRYVHTMRQSGTLLLRLIDDSLQQAGLDPHGSGLRLAPFAPELLCRQVLELMRPLATAKQLVLQFELADALPDWMQGDAMRIEQVLFNTLGNAIKYTPEGKVCLTTTCQQGHWWLWIHDTGPGIPALHHQRVFRRFGRLPSAAGAAGLGLGLAMSRDWVRQMGGQISLHAATERGVLPSCVVAPLGTSGTVVRIRLPVRISSVAGEPRNRVA